MTITSFLLLMLVGLLLPTARAPAVVVGSKQHRIDDNTRGIQTNAPSKDARRERPSLEEANVLKRLASTHLDAKDFVSAEPLLIRSVQLFKELQGEESLGYAIGLDLLGCTYLWTGRHELAESCLTDAR